MRVPGAPGGSFGFDYIPGQEPPEGPKPLTEMAQALAIIATLVNTNINYQERLTTLSDRLTRLEIGPKE